MKILTHGGIQPGDFLEEWEFAQYLWQITGERYGIASASDRKLSENAETEHGDFYQVMPHDNPIDPFFIWYSTERQYQQFFASPAAAVLQFVKYWLIWKGEIRK